MEVGATAQLLFLTAVSVFPSEVLFLVRLGQQREEEAAGRPSLEWAPLFFRPGEYCWSPCRCRKLVVRDTLQIKYSFVLNQDM
jgi:hypothetical protein